MSDQDIQATGVVKKYAAYSVGAGLIPFAAVDFAAIAGVEYKMLADLAVNQPQAFAEIAKQAKAALEKA